MPVIGGGGGGLGANMTWEELDEKVNTYPMDRKFQAIGEGGQSFIDEVVALIEKALGRSVPSGNVTTRPSKKGKYVAVNVTVRLENGERGSRGVRRVEVLREGKMVFVMKRMYVAMERRDAARVRCPSCASRRFFSRVRGDHAAVGDDELSLRFLQVKRVHHLDHPRVAPSLPDAEPDVRGVGEDVPADGLLGVHSGEGHAGRVGLDLVRVHHGDVEFIGDFVELGEELAEPLLALGELAAADEIDPEVGHDAVDDQNLEGLLGEFAREKGQGVVHHLVGERSRDEDVVENGIRVKVEPLCDLDDALGPERALGVDEGDLSAATALVQGQLGGHGEGVADLGLAAPEMGPMGVRRMYSCVSKGFGGLGARTSIRRTSR